MTFEEWWISSGEIDQESGALKGLTAIAWLAWDAATAAERERCARVAEGIERPEDRDWIKGSLYDTLRRETAAEIRRTP